MDDNLYPSGGQQPFDPFNEPADQKLEREREESAVSAGKKEIQKLIKHLDKRIAATDSVKEVLGVAEKYSLSRENALVVADIVRTQLENEKEALEGKL